MTEMPPFNPYDTNRPPTFEEAEQHMAPANTLRGRLQRAAARRLVAKAAPTPRGASVAESSSADGVNKRRVDAARAQTAESKSPMGRLARAMEGLREERDRRAADSGSPGQVLEKVSAKGEQVVGYSKVTVLDQFSHRNNDGEPSAIVAELPANPLLPGSSKIDHITLMQRTAVAADPNAPNQPNDEIVLTVESVSGADRYTHGITFDLHNGNEDVVVRTSKKQENGHYDQPQPSLADPAQALAVANVVTDALLQAKGPNPPQLML
jgi:hypothetical protein